MMRISIKTIRVYPRIKVRNLTKAPIVFYTYVNLQTAPTLTLENESGASSVLRNTMTRSE